MVRQFAPAHLNADIGYPVFKQNAAGGFRARYAAAVADCFVFGVCSLDVRAHDKREYYHRNNQNNIPIIIKNYEVEDFKVNNNKKANTQTSKVYTTDKTYKKDDEYTK